MSRGYLERTDELAQNVIDTWNASGTNFTPEFGALLNKAIVYKTAREKAEKHRAFDILSDRDKAGEREAAVTFLRAYKTYCDRQAARFN